MEIKYLIVRDLVNKEDILVEYIDAKSMQTDLLTNGLRPIVFKKYVENMDILESFDFSS